MTQINIDDELYEKVKSFVKKDYIEYPSITNFIERATKDKLEIEFRNFLETQKIKEEAD